jgi:GxxExxY protein
MLYSELTHEIIDACFEVSNELGMGFLESVYQNALLLALRQKGIAVQVQVPLVMRFRGQVVGQFVADMVVEGKVLLELKAVRALTNEHKAQTVNYLVATGIEVGLLIDFGTPRVEHHRLYRPGGPGDPRAGVRETG